MKGFHKNSRKIENEFLVILCINKISMEIVHEE